jgi:Rieske Fe-S protein
MQVQPSRRAVLALPCAVGAVAAFAGCTTYGGSSGAPPPPPAPEEPAGTTPASGAPKPAPLARVGDIPVGGGKIFEEQRVVLTQPQAGVIKAFSVVCTHQGCPVTKISGGTINCPCHGSRFKVEDGSVAGGPAPSPLPAVKVTVTGDAITLG